jgi:hypothetical protein
VTDSSGWWGDWRLVLTAVLSVLGAGIVTVVVRDVDPATADTVLTAAADAEVVVDGRHVTATEGMVVPAGASVLTGDAGSATLETADREVYLGAATTVGVVDGVRQSLERGLVMIDGRDAAPLALETPAGTVAVAAGALARVDNEVSLRLGVFEGIARMTALGRRATTEVPALHQLRTPYGGLPGAPTALALRGDRWEQLLVADLLAADTDLNGLAKGLENAKGDMVVNAASRQVRDVVSVVPTTPGEKALATAVAEAAPDVAPQEAAAQVVTARREGGSWGVVAALVEARVTEVSAVLDRILEPAVAPPLQAGPQPPLDGLLTPRPGSTGGGSSRGPGGNTNGIGSPRPSPTRTPTPTPTSVTPSPPTTAVDDVVTAVQKLVSPSPSPVASGRSGGIWPFP